MPVSQMPVGQMSVGQMSVGQMSVGQMSVGQMSVCQMSAGQINDCWHTVGQMSYLPKVCWQNVCQPNVLKAKCPIDFDQMSVGQMSKQFTVKLLLRHSHYYYAHMSLF